MMTTLLRPWPFSESMTVPENVHLEYSLSTESETEHPAKKRKEAAIKADNSLFFI